MAAISQFSATYSAIVCGTTFIAFFISSCGFFVGILKDISKELSTLDYNQQITLNERIIEERFINIVQMHSDAKRLVDEFNVINRFVIVSHFLWTISAISCTLLVFQLQLVRSILFYRSLFFS